MVVEDQGVLKIKYKYITPLIHKKYAHGAVFQQFSDILQIAITW